jgi:peptide-methionine (S)-S-oxide reductase
MSRRSLFGISLSALLLATGAGFLVSRSAAESAHEIPAPALDSPASENAALETIVLAGGCFWGVQGVFQHTKGVTNAVSGYAGGNEKTANYKDVTTGTTGHAEAVQVTYDPRQISYGRILQIFYSVVHDPTQLNRQGPDFGPQYRSAIFPRNPEQARIAKAYIDQLNRARAFSTAIVTKIEPDRKFYSAEEYHQDFMMKYPTHPYIVYHDIPKVRDLRRLFPDLFRVEPVLVAGAKAVN